MRVFEILLVGTWMLSMARIWWVGRKVDVRELVLATLVVVLMGVHFVAEGPRLILALVYVGVSVHLALTLVRWWKEPGPGPAKRSGLGLAGSLVGATLCALPGWLLPVPTLPIPTGPYAVGLTRQEWVAGDRRLAVDLWYPARPEAGSLPTPPWTEVLALAGELTGPVGLGWIPTSLFDQANLTRGHTWRNAPFLDAENCPVLLFSPGYGSPQQLYTGILETMVSHGYVVVSIAHPGQNLIVYPDGRFLGLPNHPNPALDQKMNDLYRDMLRANDDDQTWTQLVARNWELRRQSPLPADLQTWAQDSRFVLDQLPRLNAERFGGRLDLAHIGAFGHSFGGATAGELVLTDPRVKAGANLDGTQEGTVLGRPLPGPFLLIEEGLPAGRIGNAMNRVIYRASPGPFYTLDVAGAFHSNFSDTALFSPAFSWLGLTGPVDPVGALQTTNRFLVEFFDQELRGKPADLLSHDAATADWGLKRRQK